MRYFHLINQSFAKGFDYCGLDVKRGEVPQFDTVAYNNDQTEVILSTIQVDNIPQNENLTEVSFEEFTAIKQQLDANRTPYVPPVLPPTADERISNLELLVLQIGGVI